MQMGSRFNKSIVSQDVRRSLSWWQHRARLRQNSTARLLSTRSTSSMDFLWESIHHIGRSRRRGSSSSRVHDDFTQSNQLPKDVRSDKRRHKSLEELLEEDLPSPLPDPSSFTRFEDHNHRVSSGTKEESCLLPRPWHGSIALSMIGLVKVDRLPRFVFSHAVTCSPSSEEWE